MSLRQIIEQEISEQGPIPFSRYMELCLYHPDLGYYSRNAEQFGKAGDFYTSSDVNAVFGRLLARQFEEIWRALGSPPQIEILELGPGRGLFALDVLTWSEKKFPSFFHALHYSLAERSPRLRERLRGVLTRFLESGTASSVSEGANEGLQVRKPWFGEASGGAATARLSRDIAESFYLPTEGTQEGAPSAVPGNAMDERALAPDVPVVVFANEFFDALPVNQAVKLESGWHQRCVGIGDDGRLAYMLAREPIAQFTALLPPALREAPLDSMFEWRDDKPAMDLGRRLADHGGAALVIDYGHSESALGDTLQAVGRHAFADVLAAPGTIDITAHVDFEALAHAVTAMGAEAYGPIVQAQFLRRLGIETRAASLKAKATHEGQAAIDLALVRLIGAGRGGMGMLFKAAGFSHAKLGAPPGF